MQLPDFVFNHGVVGEDLGVAVRRDELFRRGFFLAWFGLTQPDLFLYVFNMFYACVVDFVFDLLYSTTVAL